MNRNNHSATNQDAEEGDNDHTPVSEATNLEQKECKMQLVPFMTHHQIKQYLRDFFIMLLLVNC